jgi:hypothetical protein
MGTNWDAGLIYWNDHVPRSGGRYTLVHLHPFIRTVDLPATDKHPARTSQIHVSFGLHTFTRATQLSDPVDALYRDNREVRTFCPERHAHSLVLPDVFQTIEKRRCEFARSESGRINYVTVETADGARYAAFFDLRRLRKVGPEAVHLMVQSAYVLDANKPTPGKGNIGFRVLLGHTLRGTNPRPPR